MQLDLTMIRRTFLACLFFSAAGHAEFVRLADFDDLLPGPIDDQDGWVAVSTSSFVTADPGDPGNLVLAVTTDSTHLHHGLSLPDGATRMLFLRFRFTGQQNFAFGLSPLVYPYQFGDFAVELSMADAGHTLRINDGGTYAALTTLRDEIWYYAWILVDNASNTSQVFLHSRPGDVATSADRLSADEQTDFYFRMTGTELRSFYVKTGGGSSDNLGPLYLDDIYLEDAETVNFDNPTVQDPDVSGDGTLDAADWAILGDCLNGPGVVQVPPTCPSAEAFARSDLDRDGDVDLRDAGIFNTRLPAE